jgi:hypothetical protein
MLDLFNTARPSQLIPFWCFQIFTKSLHKYLSNDLITYLLEKLDHTSNLRLWIHEVKNTIHSL